MWPVLYNDGAHLCGPEELAQMEESLTADK